MNRLHEFVPNSLKFMIVVVLLTPIFGCSVNNHQVPNVTEACSASEVRSSEQSTTKTVKVSYYGGPGEDHKLSKKTASGERFDSTKLTAAHRTLPFGTLVHLKSISTGKHVVVRVNDRGPFVKDREIDITHSAAEQIGIVRAGIGRVQMSVEEQAF